MTPATATDDAASHGGTAAPTPRPASAGALGLVLFAVAFGTNVPTPLLLLYRERLGLSATQLTLIFAVYAVGLLPALFLAGPWSDRRGRRPVVVPFTIVSAVASAIFLGAASNQALLYLARLAQGAVSGAVFSVGSAWMGELDADTGRASRTAAAALSLGFGLGPLVAGTLGQFAPAPTVLPYLVHLALTAAALLLLRRVPESRAATPGRGPLLNLGVPRAARRGFLLFATPAALCVFTFPSVAVVVMPLRLQAAMPGIDLLVTGAVAGITLTTGAWVQRLEARLGMRRAAPLGALAGAVGLVFGLLGARLDAPVLLLPAAVLLGTGYGLTLAAGLTATQRMADAAHRGALVSTFYAIAYLGFGVPVVISMLSRGTAFDAALVGLTAVAVALAALLAVGPGARLSGQHN